MNHEGYLSGNHLSDEELYEELERPKGLSAEEHLAGCAKCRAEVEAMRASLTALRMAATGLAESEFQPRLEMRRAGVWHAMRQGVLAWPLTMAAAGLVCAVSLTLVHRPVAVSVDDGAKTEAAVAAARPADTDDALLEGIDQDLSTAVAPSLAPLDTSAADGVESAAKAN